MPSIYQKLKDAGCELDHHESDLYVKATPEANNILMGYRHKQNVTSFMNDGQLWLEIPFEYEPFWEDKNKMIDALCNRFKRG